MVHGWSNTTPSVVCLPYTLRCYDSLHRRLRSTDAFAHPKVDAIQTVFLMADADELKARAPRPISDRTSAAILKAWRDAFEAFADDQKVGSSGCSSCA